jgi:DNA repair protein RadC
MLFLRGTNNRYRVADEDDVIFEAIQIYNRTFSKGEPLTNPDKAKDCIKCKAPFRPPVKASLSASSCDFLIRSGDGGYLEMASAH